jgi:hypothetical protein
VAFKEGAPNDVRTLWKKTLAPAVKRLEEKQNEANRVTAVDGPAPKKMSKTKRRRNKPKPTQ